MRHAQAGRGALIRRPTSRRVPPEATAARDSQAPPRIASLTHFIMKQNHGGYTLIVELLVIIIAMPHYIGAQQPY